MLSLGSASAAEQVFDVRVLAFLFGNLEIADIEQMPPDRFEEKVRRALNEGTAGEGRGFVLMPSAAPYGRSISATTMRNYETMIRLSGA